ncbi:MAG: DUF4258 domain-containing protein [bacterium]
MSVKFSSHALKRIKERFIAKQTILNSLNNPDKLEKSIKDPNRFLVKKLYFNRHFQKEHLLIIIFEENKNIKEIVTIIDTSKINKYLS